MRLVLILLPVLSGCTDFPEVDAASRDVTGPAPVFLPLEQILAAPAPIAEARGDALAAGAAALRRQSAP